MIAPNQTISTRVRSFSVSLAAAVAMATLTASKLFWFDPTFDRWKFRNALTALALVIFVLVWRRSIRTQQTACFQSGATALCALLAGSFTATIWVPVLGKLSAYLAPVLLFGGLPQLCLAVLCGRAGLVLIPTIVLECLWNWASLGISA